MRPPVVEEKVRKLPAGTVLSAADLTDITNARNASTQLARLCHEGLIERVRRGIYWVLPRVDENGDNLEYEPEPDRWGEYDLDPPFRLAFSERTTLPDPLDPMVGPDPHAIAEAIARANHWDVAPSSSLALAMLGLPGGDLESLTYASSGPSTTYDMGDRTIAFRHVANRYLSGLSADSRLIVQALVALGREDVTAAVVETISSHMTQHAIERFVDESPGLPPWMGEFAKRLSEVKIEQVFALLDGSSFRLTRDGGVSLADLLNGDYDASDSTDTA